MNLKEIRLKQGLSVPALVKLSGVPRRTIQNIEKNNDCKVSTALLLSKALNVTLDELCISEPREWGSFLYQKDTRIGCLKKINKERDVILQKRHRRTTEGHCQCLSAFFVTLP